MGQPERGGWKRRAGWRRGRLERVGEREERTRQEEEKPYEEEITNTWQTASLPSNHNLAAAALLDAELHGRQARLGTGARAC